MHNARCTTQASDGRRCSSLLYPGHSTLCHHHLRQQLNSAPPSEDIAADLLDSIQNFQSATAVNAALGKILAMLAAGRIKRQDAIAMAYICQLMLQSLKGFKHEILLTTYEKIWERDLLKVLNARTPLQDFAFPPPVEEEVQQEQAQRTPAPQQPNPQPPAPPPAEQPQPISPQETILDNTLAKTEPAAEEDRPEENGQKGNGLDESPERYQHQQHHPAPQENCKEAKEDPQPEKMQAHAPFISEALARRRRPKHMFSL